MWNPSICDCECRKACKTYKYLDIKNCSCESYLIGKLVLECQVELKPNLMTKEKKERKKHVKKIFVLFLLLH